MKKQFVITILLLTFSIVLYSQKESNSFLIENDKLLWQKIFITEMSFDQLTLAVIESGVLSSINIEENKIVGESKLFEAEYKGAGFSEFGTPMYIARSFFEGYCVIDFKDGRYRVTIRNIMLTQKYSDGLSTLGEKRTIESFAVNIGKDTLKPSFNKKPAIILDYTFNKAFTFSMAEDDEW